MSIPTLQSMMTGHSLLSFQLLQYHILMPSLLISNRSWTCPECPSRLENIRAAKLANHLAINQLSHMVIGQLAHQQQKKWVKKNDVCSGSRSCSPAWTLNATVHPSTIKPPNSLIGPDVQTTEPAVSTTELPAPTTIPAAPTTIPATRPVVPTIEPPAPTTITAAPATRTAVPTIANPGQFPFLTSIQVTNFYKTSLHLCGGTIISPSWILTAAHCLETETPKKLVVVSGVTDIGRPYGSDNINRVDELFMHPNYTHFLKPYRNDVGLIRLAEPIIEGEFVKVAALPQASFSNLEDECHEPGWGALRDNEPGSNAVKVSTVPILPKERCDSAYSALLGENSICAGQDGRGSCVGDNGGPLVCNSMPVAVMSWREGCAQAGKPAVYMDIVKYLPWIRNVTELEL